MDNYKSLLMETIAKNDLVSKPAKIKRAGKLKEDLLPDEVYNTLVRKSKKTYTVGVYSTLPGPGWHYEINTEYGVYTKVPDDEGFIAHWFLQGLPQESEEDVERVAKRIINQYGCKEVSLDEYKRIVNGKNESLKEDVAKKNIEFTRSNIVKVLRNLGYEADVVSKRFKSGDYILEFDKRNNVASVYPLGKSDEEYDNIVDALKVFGRKIWTSPIKTCISIYGNESLTEDTVKTSDGKWTNKGKEGTHGKFRTKKEADAQRKAMFSNGYREGLKESKEADIDDAITQTKKFLSDVYHKVPSIEHYGKNDNFSFTLPKDSHVFSTSALKKHLKKNGIDVKIKRFSHPQLTHGDIEFTVYLDSEKNESLKEDFDTLYGITCRTTARGMQSLLTLDDKTVAFTSKEEASRCSRALDDSAGHVNRFVYYGVTQISGRNSENLLIFDSYEEYEEYSDNFIENTRNQEEIARNKLLTVANGIVDELKEGLVNAGLNIVGEYDKHKTYKDVDIRVDAYPSRAEIRIGAGISINGWSYGTITLSVNEDGIVRCDDSSCYVFDEPFEECSQYIVKKVKKLCERSIPKNESLKESTNNSSINWMSKICQEAENMCEKFYSFNYKTNKLSYGPDERRKEINKFWDKIFDTSPNIDELHKLNPEQYDLFIEELDEYIERHVPKDGHTLIFYGRGGLNDLPRRVANLSNKKKNESLKERYASDAVTINSAFKKKLNKICQKYSGFHLPQEIAPMWKELYDLGIEVLIQGYPTDTAPGAKSWTVPFTLNGETVDNSRFVYSVYEGSTGLKNDYNMYFS